MGSQGIDRRAAGVEIAQSHGGIRPVGQPVAPVQWFRRMPVGGTVFVKPVENTEPAE